MSVKITDLRWHYVDTPFEFYKFYTEINGRHVHSSQVAKSIVDATGLTPPESLAKLLRMEIDGPVEQQRTRTFND